MPDFSHEFPLDDDLIYLNHAAVSPWPRRTAEAVSRFAEENLHRGSLGYLDWLEVESNLRQQMAKLIGAPAPDTIALVKNTSEALSIVAHGLDWQTGDVIVSSDQEFPSNRIVWESLQPQGVELRQIHLASAEDPEQALMDAVDEHTRMIAISSVQYADGLRLNLERIGQFCKQHDILFCVDAIQSIGAHRLDVQACHADFVMADGHKWMLGPEGLGLFYCAPQHLERLRLHQYGWHMVEHAGDFDRRQWQPATTARRFEPGSPNMLTIHALDASLSLLLEVGMEEIERRVVERSRYIVEQVHDSDAQLLSRTAPGRLAGIVTFRRADIDAATLQARLQEQGVFCALRGGGLRFSPHFYTPLEKISLALESALS